MELDWVFLFVVPVVLSTFVVFSQNARNDRWAVAGLCSLFAVAFGVVSSDDPRLATFDLVAQFVLVAALPYGALFLASRAPVVARRPLVFFILGPAAYWVGYVVAVNLWLALGYRL